MNAMLAKYVLSVVNSENFLFLSYEISLNIIIQ